MTAGHDNCVHGFVNSRNRGGRQDDEAEILFDGSHLGFDCLGSLNWRVYLIRITTCFLHSGNDASINAEPKSHAHADRRNSLAQ
jgi:hypothetical protein